MGKDDRAKLYPRCGRLNPDGLAALARADDYEQVKAVAEYYAVSKVFEYVIQLELLLCNCIALAFYKLSFLFYFTFYYLIYFYYTQLIYSITLFKQEYSALFEGAGNNPGDKTLEDKFFEHEASTFVVLLI